MVRLAHDSHAAFSLSLSLFLLFSYLLFSSLLFSHLYYSSFFPFSLPSVFLHFFSLSPYLLPLSLPSILPFVTPTFPLSTFSLCSSIPSHSHSSLTSGPTVRREGTHENGMSQSILDPFRIAWQDSSSGRALHLRPLTSQQPRPILPSLSDAVFPLFLIFLRYIVFFLFVCLLLGSSIFASAAVSCLITMLYFTVI